MSMAFRGLFTTVAVKCQMVGPAERQGWPGENLQVSLFPSLCFASLVCDVGHGTIHQDEQQDLLLAKEGRNRASAQGTAAEPSKPHGHYFKSCRGDSFC